jgi:hypothetical protein
LNKRSCLARINPHFGFAIPVPSKAASAEARRGASWAVSSFVYPCMWRANGRLSEARKRQAWPSPSTATSLHPLMTGGRSDTLPLALTATCPGTPSRAHGPPYSGSRRLLNTSEGFRSAAKDSPRLHGYPGPRGRFNEEGGAGEGCPTPDAWAGPEVDSVSKCT